MVVKSWGCEDVFANNDKYCGKLLHFRKGTQGSLHYHAIKEESWLILKGEIEVQFLDNNDNNGDAFNRTLNGENIELNSYILEEGDNIDIEPYMAHRVVALEDTVILEVSTPHSDEDVYRLISSPEKQ